MHAFYDSDIPNIYFVCFDVIFSLNSNFLHSIYFRNMNLVYLNLNVMKYYTAQKIINYQNLSFIAFLWLI